MRMNPEKTNPDISVIIAAYNASSVIGYQLDALAQQISPPKFEVIISDNRSTDNLKETVSKYKNKLNIRIISADKRQGQSYARNYAATLARGEKLAFCDADDIVSNNWLSEIYKFLEDDCIVTTPLASFSPQNGEKPESIDLNERKTTDFMIGLNKFPFASGGSFGCYRNAYLELGGMDESFIGGSEDIDFSWRFTESGRKLKFASEAVLYYRSRNSNKNAFIQVYRYARENVLLWKRAHNRGVKIKSVSYKVAVFRVLEIPFIFLSKRGRLDFETCANFGGRVGALSGNLKYRILKRKNKPELFKF